MLNPVVLADLEAIDRVVAGDRRFEDAVVLVTGCAGFLGFYILQYLVRFAPALGVRRVLGLDSFKLAKPKWLTELSQAFPEVLEVREFDVSRGDLADIRHASAATFVIHMASIASPSFYRRFPVETVDANVWGLRRLLDFLVRSEQLKGFLFFSSSEIYGDPPADRIPTGEEYRGYVSCIGPRSCYDEAKRFGETLCYIYATAYGMPITIARPFNNYGPGMRLDDRRLPADFAKCVLEGKDIVIFSDGSPTRTFCYVADAVAGYLKCLTYGKFDYFNIGNDKPEITVARLAEIYRETGARILGYSGTIRREKSADVEYLADNPQRRCPVIDKARDKLGFEPRVLVDQGVERYLRYLAYEARQPA